MLPESFDSSLDKLFVEIYTRGVTGEKALTIRYTKDHNYRSSSMLISRSGAIQDSDIKEGDLVVRLIYKIDGQIVTEEDMKLFSK